MFSKKYNKKNISYILFLFFSYNSFLFSQSTTVVGAFLEKDIIPSSNSLAGSGFTKPQGVEFHLSNPSQLLHSTTFEALSSYLYGGFNNNYTSFLILKRFWKMPFSLSTTLLIPQNIDYLADTGEILGSANYLESVTSLGTAYEFNIYRQKVYVGLNLKYYLSRLHIYTSHSFASDLAFTLPFKIIKWDLLDRNPDNENLHVTVSFLNMGSPIRYIQQSYNLPTSLLLGAHWNMVDFTNHQIDLMYGMKFYLTENRPYSWLVNSIGVQYSLYNILYVRTGAKYEQEKIKMNFGIGLGYVISENYIFKLDYDFNAGTFYKLDQEHNISLKFSLKAINYSSKISETTKTIENTARTMENLIVDIVQESINEYKTRNGYYPEDLKALQSILKEKYGLETLPQPTEGVLHYLPKEGQVVIIKKNNDEFKETIVFKDGSRILGKIEKDLGDNLFIVHQYGSMTIPKNSVEKIEVFESANIDDKIVKDIQQYIFQFQKMKGRYPFSLKDLEQYIYLFGISKLPVPKKGMLSYNDKTGLVKLIDKNVLNQENIQNKINSESDQRERLKQQQLEETKNKKNKISVEEDFLLNY